MCASARPDIAEIFLKEIDNPGVSDTMRVANRNPLLVSLDHKLFAGIVNMLVAKQQANSDDSVRLLTRIRNCVNLGSGRQAMRVLDADYMREGPRRRQRAISELYALKAPSKAEDVEAHVVRIECLLLDSVGTVDEPSEAMLTSMLRMHLNHQQKFAPIFAQVDLFGQLPFASLLQAIKTVCADTRESRSSKAQGKAAAAQAKDASPAAAGKGKGRDDGKGKGQ